MTIRDLKQIIEDLEEDTVILIEENEVRDIRSITIRILMDGRSHLILSALE